MPISRRSTTRRSVVPANRFHSRDGIGCDSPGGSSVGVRPNSKPSNRTPPSVMAKQDFYETLGVSKSASADELKRAYRKLAMQYHPDRNAGDKGAEQKFKDLNEAYDVLKDDQKRAAYDRFGHAAFEQGGGRGPGDFGFAAGGFADIFDEMFGEFMGGGRRGQ